MLLNAGCELTFESDTPTPLILMLRPRSGYGQWVAQERYTFTPMVPVTEYIDRYGNLCQRVEAPVGRFEIQTSAEVETSPTIDVQPWAQFTLVQDLPDNVLEFLLPSRYCQSDLLGAKALEITKDAQPGYEQAEAIRRWVHDTTEYRYGASDPSTSAIDTLASKSGVCRDFVHLAVALCRAINIPARMVVGYLFLLDPMDLHAWFEAFIGGRWYIFDATQALPRGGRIAIAYGRDAADVALATQFGPARLTEMKVWVEARESGAWTIKL